MKLEDYIAKNRELFDSESLSPGHEAKFEEMLNAHFRTKTISLWKYAAAIAASVIIFMGATLYFFYFKKANTELAFKQHQPVEFIETEQYYSQQDSLALEKLKQVLALQPSAVKEPILKEFSQMDQDYRQMKEELKNNPDDERIMSTIIQHYQLKLDMVNTLIDKFRLYSNNFKSHEHESI